MAQYMTGSEVLLIKRRSCSKGNFAANLAKRLFSREELMESNCSGAKGKKALDPERISLICQEVQRLYGIPEKEFDEAWRGCRVAIDTYARKVK